MSLSDILVDSGFSCAASSSHSGSRGSRHFASYDGINDLSHVNLDDVMGFTPSDMPVYRSASALVLPARNPHDLTSAGFDMFDDSVSFRPRDFYNTWPPLQSIKGASSGFASNGLKPALGSKGQPGSFSLEGSVGDVFFEDCQIGAPTVTLYDRSVDESVSFVCKFLMSQGVANEHNEANRVWFCEQNTRAGLLSFQIRLFRTKASSSQTVAEFIRLDGNASAFSSILHSFAECSCGTVLPKHCGNVKCLPCPLVACELSDVERSESLEAMRVWLSCDGDEAVCGIVSLAMEQSDAQLRVEMLQVVCEHLIQEASKCVGSQGFVNQCLFVADALLQSGILYGASLPDEFVSVTVHSLVPVIVSHSVCANTMIKSKVDVFMKKVLKFI